MQTCITGYKFYLTIPGITLYVLIFHSSIFVSVPRKIRAEFEPMDILAQDG